MRKADLASLRSHNQLLLLRQIQRLQPISMAALAQETGLQPSTVSRLVYQLERQEVIATDGFSVPEPGGGRPAAQWILNSQFAASIGLYLASNMVAGVAIDLNQNLLATCALPLSVDARSSVAKISRVLNQAVDVLTNKEHIGGRPLLGVGVASMGLVSPEAHTVRYFGLDLLVRDLLPAHLGPVRVENDANVVAKGERQHGVLAEARNALVLYAHEGLGAGLIFDGRVYLGETGAAGEVEEQTHSLLPNPVVSGDEKTLNEFCLGVGALVNFLNPKICLLTGDLYEQRERLVPALKRQLGALSNPAARGVEVLAKNCDPMGVARYAATLVFDDEVFLLGGDEHGPYLPDRAEKPEKPENGKVEAQGGAAGRKSTRV